LFIWEENKGKKKVDEERRRWSKDKAV